MENRGEILIYQTEDKQTEIEVRMDTETVWLSLNQISDLLDRDKSVVSRHIYNIFKDGELPKDSTVAKYATVQIEGNRSITREIEYYNLDVVISVGFRVKSKRGTQFRIWANEIIKEYLTSGYALNKRLLKQKTDKLKELNNLVKLLSGIAQSNIIKSDAPHKSNNLHNYMPFNMLIYKYSKNMNYKHFINLINYIYGDEIIIDNETFFNKIYNGDYFHHIIIFSITTILVIIYYTLIPYSINLSYIVLTGETNNLFDLIYRNATFKYI